jgi:hypothetical protein
MVMAILQDVSAKALQAQLDALKAENAMLKAKAIARNNRALSWKVSEKGAVSIYGLGRFPVTLYWSQITKLNAVWADVMAFAETCHANGELKEKPID